MSSVGQAVGGIVGAVVGWVASGFTPMGAIYGAQLGMMAGGLIDPPKGPVINGPRLDDLSVQTSTYGAFISRNYGTVAQNGNVFWLQGDKLTEVKTTTSGGKGGPSTTTNSFSYYATFAVGLCDGPIDGVSKIWIGPDLFYDAGAPADGVVTEQYIQTVIASNAAAASFTLYTGTDTQLPDPLIQADKGVANTPAYRGLAYIVFNNLALAKYSNSLMGAQVKVEIVKTASNNLYYNNVTIPSANWGAVAWSGSVFVMVENGGTNTAFSYDGVNWIKSSILSGNWNAIAYGLGVFCAVSVTGSAGNSSTSNDGVSWVANPMPSANSWESIACSTDVFCAVASNNTYGPASAISKNGIDWAANAIPTAVWVKIIWNGSVFCATSSGTLSATSPDGISWKTGSLPYSDNWSGLAWNGSVFCAVSLNGGNSAISADGIAWTIGGALPVASGWVSVAANGSEFLAINNASLAVAASSVDGITWINVAVPAYAWVSVINAGGMFLAIAKSASLGSVIIYRKIVSSDALLTDVIQSECLISNLLTASDLDVTELTDTVRGYRVSSIGAIRGSIDPLRAAWPFDVVQHGYQIKFKKRGSASVATIDASLLDARMAGDAPGVRITDSREMDLVLPRKVTVKYLDVSREYDTNEQYASRINTDAVNERVIDLPIVFDATEAMQKAESLLYLYWLERYDITIKLPQDYAYLEPGDVITVNGENATYELRLIAVNTTATGIIECQAKYNNASIYVSSVSSTGSEGLSTGSALTTPGNSTYQLLDIPLLSDSYDTAGFPVAMTGYLTSWTGGILYRSDDNGQTWIDLSAFPPPGTVIGYATNTIGIHGGTVLDKSSLLAVRLYAGTLASITQDQLFAGQNWFAYGVDGRWEIIAAQKCVLQADGSYILSDFMRGQMGSEWATGLHAANDRIILLDITKLGFIAVNSSSIGTLRNYRAITSGATLDSDTNRAFTYRGVNLECLSPCQFTGSRHPTTRDWALTWTRRTRYAGWRDYVDAALGETTEAYELDIYSDATYATVKRTLAASTPTVSYTSAQQVTDFGTNQSTLYVKVYQLSSTVGRGYPLTTTITRS